MIQVKTRDVENNIDTLSKEVEEIKDLIDKMKAAKSKLIKKSKEAEAIQKRLNDLYNELDDKEYKIEMLQEEESYMIEDYVDKISQVGTQFRVTLVMNIDDIYFENAHVNDKICIIGDTIHYNEHDRAIKIEKVSKVKNNTRAQQIKKLKKEFVQECKDRGYKKSKIASMWDEVIG